MTFSRRWRSRVLRRFCGTWRIFWDRRGLRGRQSGHIWSYTGAKSWARLVLGQFGPRWKFHGQKWDQTFWTGWQARYPLTLETTWKSMFRGSKQFEDDRCENQRNRKSTEFHMPRSLRNRLLRFLEPIFSLAAMARPVYLRTFIDMAVPWSWNTNMFFLAYTWVFCWDFGALVCGCGGCDLGMVLVFQCTSNPWIIWIRVIQDPASWFLTRRHHSDEWLVMCLEIIK